MEILFFAVVGRVESQELCLCPGQQFKGAHGLE
jgi:hypothetical protein